METDFQPKRAYFNHVKDTSSMNMSSSPSETHQGTEQKQEAVSTFTKLRAKLSFDRMVAMGAKMGMPNPLFLCADRAAKATIHINGKDYINFSTYDYLDINTHPEITAAVTEAARVFGTSAGASRLVGGERTPHHLLEEAIAKFMGTEDCIVYVSGHATNVSTIGFLFGPRDLILYDQLSHNSLAQGARLSGATKFPFQHNSCDDLERLLEGITSSASSSRKAFSAWTAIFLTCRASSNSRKSTTACS